MTLTDMPRMNGNGNGTTRMKYTKIVTIYYILLDLKKLNDVVFSRRHINMI